MPRNFRTLSLGELLDELAAADPAPGSGAVAALVVAAAGALLTGAARASRPTWPDAGGVAAQAALLRTRGFELAAEISDAYARALAVLEAPSGESAEERDASIAQALSHAADAPLEIARAAGDAAELAALVTERGEPATQGDAGAAALLAVGAARAAASLVDINLTAVPGDIRVDRARKLAADAEYAARRALGPRWQALH
jgi:formiminotetrahydrofolate cyclodeaminase